MIVPAFPRAPFPANEARACPGTWQRGWSLPRGKSGGLPPLPRPQAFRDMQSDMSHMQPVELDDDFSALKSSTGLMTVAGFGSLLSERSARTTFPNLQGFRPARVRGWRRVFAHTSDIFFLRGIAKPETISSKVLSRAFQGEIASLSCEPCAEEELVVSLFEVPHSPESVQAFIAREHEFRFCMVSPVTLDGQGTGERAVLCARYTDEEYKQRRCPPEEFSRRWAVYGIDRVWRDDVLPCRVYLRHCILAARSFCPEAYDNFMNHTFLSDRKTTVAEHLARNPGIMDELPPPELSQRYSG